MKMLKSILLFTLAAIVLIGLYTFFRTDLDASRVRLASGSDRCHDYDSKYVAKDKYWEQYVIGDLFWVSANGFVPSVQNTEKLIKVDIAPRKRFFSVDAWEQYQKFAALQKGNAQYNNSCESSAEFTNATQKYTMGPNGLIKFYARGCISYGCRDVSRSGPPFELNISYSYPPINNSPTLQIQKWDVTIAEDSRHF